MALGQTGRLTLERYQSSISSRNASPDIETSMVSISKTGNVIRRARFPHCGQGSPGLAWSCDPSSGFWNTSFSA